MKETIPHLKVPGSDFYHSSLGKINARIITTPTIRLNDLLLNEFGKGNSALIMGCAEGAMVRHFTSLFSQLRILEGSSELCQSLALQCPQINIINTYFENYRCPKNDQVDWILANHVLEHLTNPIDTLKQAHHWLKQTGRILITVPNATSLHRKIGVRMGILKTVYDLSENDHIVGHQRVYDLSVLLDHIYQAGFKPLKIGGYNLKMVSQKQMADYSENLLDALFDISLECPAEICSNLYLVAEI